MFCKKCGKYNSSYNKACIYCGGELEEKKPEKEGFYNGSAWQSNQQNGQTKGRSNMFCKKCGKYNPSYNKVCMYCGGELEERKPEKESFYNGSAWQSNQQNGQSKRDVGVLLALFLGIIGLIIGLLMYESGSYERETFLSGWVKCFVVCFIIGIVLSCFVYCGACSLIGRYY